MQSANVVIHHVLMTYPRSHLVDPAGGIYHVCSRCVRRAFLCGLDPVSKRNLNHRKAWLKSRITELADIFSIDLFGYAVMSNHYHLVLRTDPTRAASWSQKEVAQRWLRLTKSMTNRERERRLALIESNPQLVEIYRERLSSLSWFMRFLNETIARRANEEDGCTGRFWQGRFQSQLLLDEAALVACMAYVDLNPVRAGVEQAPGDSETTSFGERVRSQSKERQLSALNTPECDIPFPMTLSEYQDLLTALASATPMKQREDSRFRTILQRLPTPGIWRRAVGSAGALEKLALSLGQHWIKRYPPSLLT